MKLLCIIFGLALSVANAHERPSIFGMPGVEKPAASETYENNPCYQKLISIDLETGQPFAETLYHQLVQKIHEETNIPIATIHQLYADQSPEKTPTDMMIELSKKGFSRCYRSETVLSKFKEQLNIKMDLDVKADTLAGIRDELKTKGFFPTPGEVNSDTTLFVKHQPRFGSSEQRISYDQREPNNVYFSIMPDPYTNFPGFTPDIFYDFFPKFPNLFFDIALPEFRVNNTDLINKTRDQTLTALREKYKGQPVAVRTSDRIPLEMFARAHTYLTSAEKSNWDYSSLAKRNALRPRALHQAVTGNFDARDFCRNGQECGSVVIEEEPIHTAYHDYLRGKQKLTIVDLGSSVGFNSIRYALTNNHVILCDRSLGALIEAGNYMLQDHPDKAENLYLTTESADQLTLPENSVDVVFMGYLIKYFPGNNIDQMLKNIFRYLKPGGKLFLAEIMPYNEFYKNYRNGPPPPITLDQLYLRIGIEDRSYKIPFPKSSSHWPGEIGEIYNGDQNFQYNLTKVTEDDVIKGLERAGFRIETNLSTTKAAKNYTHMPAIQIIAIKP